jgi:hypothetical protein
MSKAGPKELQLSPREGWDGSAGGCQNHAVIFNSAPLASDLNIWRRTLPSVAWGLRSCLA